MQDGIGGQKCSKLVTFTPSTTLPGRKARQGLNQARRKPGEGAESTINCYRGDPAARAHEGASVADS